MDLIPYAARLHRDLRVAAEAGGEETLAVAERLAAGLESSIRLVLLDALVEACAAITRDLAPGSVEVRLRGRDVDFAVTPVPGLSTPAAPTAGALGPQDGDDGVDDGGTARLSLRLPERLKPRVERAAEAAGLSVNAWLVRSIGALVETQSAASAAQATVTTGQRHTGWVR
jgi:hypothetical protein